MLNPPLQQTRQPRGIVKINGVAVTGWIDLEVTNNAFYQSDNFNVTFSISALTPPYNLNWFSAQQVIAVEIFAGFPVDVEKFSDADLQSLIYGNVDDIHFNPTSQTIEISGRDLTSVLIDQKTTQKYPNLTSSQIAKQIALAHGLTAIVTATKTKSGVYYQIDHARLSDARSEWDLLTWLAREEAFVVYIKGQTLHFEPKADLTSDPYVLQWTPPVDVIGYSSFNGKSLSFSRNLTIAKGVTVVIRSWNAKNKKAFTVSYPTNKAKGISPGQSSTASQVYERTIAGLTPEKALIQAQALQKEITAHEVSLSATLPADNVLKTNSLIKVVGTNSLFDQLYYPDNIRRNLSIGGGYDMSISAKNHSPVNEVSL